MENVQARKKRQTAAVHYRTAYQKEKKTNRRLILALLILTCLLAFLLIKTTARSAEAEHREDQAKKYYTSIVIDPGDTLWSIAEEYRTDQYASVYDYMQEIVDINHLHGDVLTSGNTLCIPYYK